jgi:hypothetical protein
VEGRCGAVDRHVGKGIVELRVVMVLGGKGVGVKMGVVGEAAAEGVGG